MLSNQCEGRMHGLLGSLPPPQLSQAKSELVAIKQAFELGDMDDEDEGN